MGWVHHPCSKRVTAPAPAASKTLHQARELAWLLTLCVERTIPEELERIPDLGIVRYAWPHLATRTLLPAVVWELP